MRAGNSFCKPLGVNILPQSDPTHTHTAPSYLWETLVPVAVNPALHRNRSADRGDLTVPRAKDTSYSDRSFAIAAPMLWNSFPVELRCSPSMTIFFQKSSL